MIAWLRLLNVLNKICIHLFIINCLNVLSIKMISNEYFTYHPRENSETQMAFCRTLTYDLVVWTSSDKKKILSAKIVFVDRQPSFLYQH